MQPMRNRERTAQRIPEARYAYYRRCQEWRCNGEQCKAPAEKGSSICHAHAGRRAMEARREAERRVVLERAAEEMRRKSKQPWTVAKMLMSFNGIQTTIAVAAQALTDGTLSCKTAGRLLWDLQCMAKLLRIMQRAKTQRTRRNKKASVVKLSKIVMCHRSGYSSPLQLRMNAKVREFLSLYFLVDCSLGLRVLQEQHEADIQSKLNVI